MFGSEGTQKTGKKEVKGKKEESYAKLSGKFDARFFLFGEIDDNGSASLVEPGLKTLATQTAR